MMNKCKCRNQSCSCTGDVTAFWLQSGSVESRGNHLTVISIMVNTRYENLLTFHKTATNRTDDLAFISIAMVCSERGLSPFASARRKSCRFIQFVHDAGYNFLYYLFSNQPCGFHQSKWLVDGNASASSSPSGGDEGNNHDGGYLAMMDEQC